MFLKSIINKVHSIITYTFGILIFIPLKILNLVYIISFFSVVQIIAYIPGKLGIFTRRIWYKTSLKKCGKRLFMEFGSMITYKETEVGNHVYIGGFSQVDMAKIGHDALIAYNIIISGKKHMHGTTKKKIMRLQEGAIRKIIIEDDVWVGSGALVFEDVAKGTIIGTGSFVNKKFEEYSIIGGVPAKIIGKRN